jgi:hypothetical protein
MWSDNDPPPPRAPRSEPEILPPERTDQRRPQDGTVWVTQHRIVFARPGPLQLLLGFLVLAVIVGIGALVLLGIVLLWLPLLAVTVIGVIVATLFRPRRRF